METLVYKEFAGRERWAPGPWDDEPDKVQFPDPDTGLPCLAVRGPMGSWCGYVGVGPTHPWYGKDYSNGCTLAAPCHKDEDSRYCDHSPASQVRVHGGLTFSESCRDATPEKYALWLKKWENYQPGGARYHEVERYPSGDAASSVAEWKAVADNYEKWAAHMQATGVCHLAGPGDFEPAWWFGFDHAHGGDAWPRRKPEYHFESTFDRGVYRTLEYVKGQLASLAKQLAAVTA